MVIQSGGATGGVPVGQEEHLDWVGELIKLPEANGGVPMKVTTQGSQYDSTPNDRNLGDMSKDMYGSMNGRSAGEVKSNGGV